MTKKIKHVLGISGGKDSSALAIYMRQNYPELEIDYFFTDTGKELPEIYSYLTMLEGFLGKPITRLNPDRDFDFWLKQHNNYLPSAQARWCTIQMKLKPFEEWVQVFLDEGYEVYSYVAIRSDEDYRVGYQSTDERIITKLPFRDDGIDKPGVMDILENSGIGLPEYYNWRSRSGCTFCFFQRKIEWLRLSQIHPQAFADAQHYEKPATDQESGFTWIQGESLEDLIKPERAKQIEDNYNKRLKRMQSKRKTNPLRPDENFIDVDDIYGQSKMCLTCHK